MTSFVLETHPALEPVTLTEMKTHARIDISADDTLITALITAARQWAEKHTGRAFITQAWRGWFDGPPESGELVLMRSPLVAVSGVQSFDDDDNGTVWAASNYYVDTAREPGRITLRSGTSWPYPGRAVNGLCVEYTAGYGSSAASVPEPLRLAVRQLATHWYEHRGEAVIMSSTRHDAVANMGGVNVPMVIHALLAPYRVSTFGGA